MAMQNDHIFTEWVGFRNSSTPPSISCCAQSISQWRSNPGPLLNLNDLEQKTDFHIEFFTKYLFERKIHLRIRIYICMCIYIYISICMYKKEKCIIIIWLYIKTYQTQCPFLVLYTSTICFKQTSMLKKTHHKHRLELL